MKTMKYPKGTPRMLRRCLSLLLLLSLLIPNLGMPASAQTGPEDRSAPAGANTAAGGSQSWVLENDRLSALVEYTGDGSIRLASFYNKTAGREYLPAGEENESTLFRYDYRMLEEDMDGTEDVGAVTTLDANDGGYTLGDVTTEDIVMHAADGDTPVIGERLLIPLEKQELHITLAFEIYEGDAGLRYQAHLRNLSGEQRLQITDADVLKLDMPEEPHNLHYVTLARWVSTTGGIDYRDVGETEDIKLVLNLYDSGDGFYMAPEVNSRTETYRREPFTEDDTDYIGRSFAGIRAFQGDGVKVAVNPEVFRLVLFPQEEFEYISVNLTAFSGDIVDGKMAVEQHLRTRFQYNNISTIINTNDWEWGHNKRVDSYYASTAIPKAREAGFDMIMFDDEWNNGWEQPGIFEGTLRDRVVPIPEYIEAVDSNENGENDEALIQGLKDLTQEIHDNGFLFGLWYSLSGGWHNRGNDLADPEVIAAKKDKIIWMIENYGLDHQMIDLTEFWPNLERTDYSHPTDNVYRKNVLSRNLMNEIVEMYPDYRVKYTTEVDIYPTMGDRSNDLLHVVNNGWTTTSTVYGESLSTPIFAGMFGHMPLDSVYFNVGAVDDSADMELYYAYMLARNVKHGRAPDTWTQDSINLMASFNHWRKSERVAALTGQMKYPVYMGRGWTSSDASDWSQENGPMAMMQMSDDKSTALLIATGGKRNGAPTFDTDLRWLDENKEYLVLDISMKDDGTANYGFEGRFDHESLRSFNIDLYSNTSKGKAFWIQEDSGEDYQAIYADDYTDTYDISADGGTITVDAAGEPGETGKVAVYGREENGVMMVSVPFDEAGEGRVEIDGFVPDEENIVPAPPPAFEVRASDLYDADEYEVSGGTAAKVAGGDTPGTSPYGMNFTSDSDEAGSYIEYHVDVYTPGVYQVQAAAKVKPGGRGVGRWYIDGEPTGEIWDQGDVSQEHIALFSLGEHVFEEAGTHVFRFEFQGGSKHTINTDRLVFTPAGLDASGSGLREAENALSTDTGGNTTLATNSDAAASGGKWVAINAAGAGDWAEFTFQVEREGTYNIALTHKGHRERGIAQLYVDGVPLGEPVDQYADTTQALYLTHDYGSLELAEGPHTFRLQVTGKNAGATKYNLSFDALTLTGGVPHIVITGGDELEAGGSLRLEAEVVNMHPFYTTGDYVKWVVESQRAENGKSKAVEITQDGLACDVTGVNAGTARLKAMSTVNADVFAVWDITVGSVSFENLQNLIAEARLLEEADYTEDSWSGFAQVLADAAALTQDADQAQVKKAYLDLLQAMDGLVAKTQTALDELNDLIVRAERLVKAEYTPESWAGLEEALSAARDMDENSGLQEILAVRKNLDQAIKALKKKSSGGSSPASPSRSVTRTIVPAPSAGETKEPWNEQQAGPTGGALYLDTKSYRMDLGNIYDIGCFLKAENGETLKVYSSREHIAGIQRLPNGNYRVAGLRSGQTTVMFEVYNAAGKLINHASVKVEVVLGAKQGGEKNIYASLF